MPTILLKKSDTPGSVPGTANLTNLAGGVEVAVNTADKRVYSMTSASAVIELGTNPSSLTLSGGTANGVLYLNGSKVATSGSALQFSGTGLGIQRAASSGYVLDIDTSAGNVARIIGSDQANVRLRFDNGGAGGRIWELVGGLPGSNNANFSIRDVTGSTTPLTIDSSGNLGIGTTSPTDKLHVVGLARINTGTYAAGYGLTFQANAETSRTYQMGMVTGGNFAIYDSTAAAQRVVLDTSGNLGLGVTPSAWNSSFRAMQLGNSGYLFGRASQTQMEMGNNAVFDATDTRWEYITTNTAQRYLQDATSNSHQWFTAGSGGAGTAISFGDAKMTLDADGRLMVGATSAAGGNFFTVERNSTTLPCYANVTGGASETVIANLDPGALITLKNLNTTNNIYTAIRGTSTNGTTNNAIFFVRESNSTHAGSIAFGTTNSSGTFAERARITSGGLFAFTDTNADKIQFNGTVANSYLISKLAGGSSLADGEFRLTAGNVTAGTFTFSSAGTERARITAGGDFLVGTQSSYGRITSQQTDGAYSTCGLTIVRSANTNRWNFLVANDNNLYLGYNAADVGYFNNSTGTYTATSDERLKKNITDIQYGLNEILSLRSVAYNMKDQEDGEVKALGFIAQEAMQVIPESVSEMRGGMYGMDKESLIPVLVKAIQELEARLAALESA